VGRPWVPRSQSYETGAHILSKYHNFGWVIHQFVQHPLLWQVPTIVLVADLAQCFISTSSVISEWLELIKVWFHPWFSPRIRVVSRVPDQEPLCIPKEKIQDWIRNIRWERSDVSHAVLYHNSVYSYGLVVTRVYPHDETCVPCNESCQWRYRSCRNVQQHVHQLLW